MVSCLFLPGPFPYFHHCVHRILMNGTVFIGVTGLYGLARDCIRLSTVEVNLNSLITDQFEQYSQHMSRVLGLS